MSENKTILVVDDVRLNTILMKQMLNALPYNVITAESGIKALEILQETKVHLILLDIMMPVMNGYEVFGAVRKNPDTNDIPIVFVSALSSSKDKDYAMGLGAEDYIAKPIELPILLKTVEKYIGQTD